jgi:signal transduction histidine kinase
MQGLVKAHIRKFIPHSPGTSAIAGSQQSALLPPTDGVRYLAPTLKPEGFDPLAHDARNVLSALKLYCELLAEPGVLTAGNSHYAQELIAISDTASKLVERLSEPRRAGRQPVATSVCHTAGRDGEAKLGEANPLQPNDLSEPWAAPERIDDFGRELLEMRPLLAGIAGPGISLEIGAMPCAGQSRLAKEDFTRVMLNLVRNASDAMPEGGRLRITAQYGEGFSFLEPGVLPDSSPRTTILTIEDSGPGIPDGIREQIFLPGFTTRQAAPVWPELPHRGLGLSIVQELIEAAGGTVRACSSSGRGARFELELPITSGTYEIANNVRIVADEATRHA